MFNYATMKKMLILLLLPLAVLTMTTPLWANGISESDKFYSLQGIVRDKQTKEPLAGAAVRLDGESIFSIADNDGHYVFEKVPQGKHRLVIDYVSYLSVEMEINIDGDLEQVLELEPDLELLKGGVVSAVKRTNTEIAMIAQQHSGAVVQTGVSSVLISKTQDKDASEVIRRIPGISVIDNKFVMVRGLSERYNNVWINHGAVSSSEADSRAFSFDIVPSSQIDNIVVVKSPSPEYPADYTGGFIQIGTKSVPDKSQISVGIGAGMNTKTQFEDFQYYKGSSTDFLGFDSGYRNFKDGINTALQTQGKGISLIGGDFHNDWKTRTRTPLPNLSLSFSTSQKWTTSRNSVLSMLASLNYGNNYETHLDMQNNLYGVYDITHDRSNFLRRSSDDQFNHNVRLGAMLNLNYLSANGNSRYEFKNIFNQLGKDRYTYRKGTNAQSDYEESAEYYYQSRTTYNGQICGKHNFSAFNCLDWNLGYAYSNRNMPDRHRYTTVQNVESGNLEIDNLNDINREFSRLDEHIFSAGLNWQLTFPLWNTEPTVKLGAYSDYRSRKYNTRLFIYGYDGGLPVAWRQMDVTTELLQDVHYGESQLYLLEQVDHRNDYEGNNLLGSAYLSLNLPLGRWNIYGGVRFEHNKMELVSNTQKAEKSPTSVFYTGDDFFPSLNIRYQFNDRHQCRLAYGKSVNRPEFREVSSSVYYDFDLASNVQGNYRLKSAYINNFDLCYEFYPSKEELVSVSLFYKNFDSPIEWTYTVAGGTDLVYSYMNAKGADNYGVEVDFRKTLDFIGLRNFSINLNGSWIKSKVRFEEGSREKNRPMQGQSPYLLNAGLFWQNADKGWTASILYNRIGKRIIGVGRSIGNAGNEVRVPDSYEMPKNTVDLSVSKKFGALELRLSARDLLAEKVVFKQFQETGKGNKDQITRSFRPGQTINVNIEYRF